MTKSQERAVAQVRRYVEGELDKNAEYGDEIDSWVVTEENFGLCISASRLMAKLPPGNLLRALDRTHYLFFVGKRGAIQMKMGPESMRQFNGRRAFGMNVAIR